MATSMPVLAPSSSGHDGKHGLLQCSSSGLHSDMKICSTICNGAEYGGVCTHLNDDDIRISHTREEPLSWKEKISQPFMRLASTGCQEDEERAKGPPPMDWGTAIWYLSGMEFIRLSCIEPDIQDSFIDDAIVTGIS